MANSSGQTGRPCKFFPFGQIMKDRLIFQLAKRSRTQVESEASHSDEVASHLTEQVSTKEPEVPKDTAALNPPILSARAQKRAKVIGDIGSDDKAKGLVRYRQDGSLEHFADHTKTWVVAVYHNDLRAELLQEAAKGGKYDHERTEGEGTTDITSFLASQKSWGSKRGNWPDVLFQVEMVKNNNLPKTVPLWYRDKKLLIDHDNRPMRDFSELLPATLSSEAEGWLMEAFLRSDRRVQMRDLRGRMPKDIIVADKTGTGNGQTTKPLFTMRTITQRTLRFRGLAGLKARDIRGGSDAINRGIEALLPVEALKKNNSKDLGRILTNAEVKAITKPNAGKYPQRGRGDKKALNANHASAVTTKTKRKRTSDLAENGEDTTMANVKRARHERGSGNAAFLEIRPVSTQGSGIGLPTPELSSTAESTPDDLHRNLSPPDHLNYSYPDSELFEPNPSDGDLFQGPAHFSTASKGVNRLDNLMSVDPHQAYRILNQDSSNRRWGVENQPYYPGVPPYGNQGAPIGGNLSHQWGLSDYPMHAPFYQIPVATEGNHHGHSLGASWIRLRAPA